MAFVLLVVLVLGPAGIAKASSGEAVNSGPVALGSENCPEAAPDPEVCGPPQEVGSFESVKDISVIFNHPVDCSAINLLLFRDGKKIGETGGVEPGQSDEVHIAWPDDGKSHELGAEAEGVTGGCNSGELLHAWAGNVEVIYTPGCQGDSQEDSRKFSEVALASSAVCKPKVTLSGTVRHHVCEGSPGCYPQVVGAPDRPVSIVGGGKTKEVETNDKGVWKVEVPRGKHYRVRLPGGAGSSYPPSREVSTPANVGNLDFTVCKVAADFDPQNIGCDLVQVKGQLVEPSGVSYEASPALAISGPGDTGQANDKGTFELYLPRGTQKISAHQNGVLFLEGPVRLASEIFDNENDLNSVNLTVKPTLSPIEGKDLRKELSFAIVGLPDSLTGSLEYQLKGPEDASGCRFLKVGTLPIAARQHSAAIQVTPGTFSSFCAERYTLTVSDGPTVLATTSFRIT